MSKRCLLAAGALLAIGGVAWLGLTWFNYHEFGPLAQTDKDLVKAATALHRTLPTEPSIATPPTLAPSQRVRLAIGSLGFPDDGQNRRVGDLLTAQLTGARGMELVDRQSLDKVLLELEMNLSGLARAKDAIKVGKLLRADWFLLGSAYSVGGTNGIIARMVDARTGILRDIGILKGDRDVIRLSDDLAAFARQCRHVAATVKPRVYLAVSGFADVGVNTRHNTFPAQLRAYLVGAYQNPDLTLLEREAVEALLQEVRLDLAGLTEEGNTREPQPLQSAFWVVDGFFQSYEARGSEVELVLHVTQAFGTSETTTLRGQPGEPFFRRIKDFIDKTLSQAGPRTIAPTRRYEINKQLAVGQVLLSAAWGHDPQRHSELWIVPENDIDRPRRQHNIEEAIKAFETALLLDHTNCEAKLYLGLCLQDWTISRLDEARHYLQEAANSKPPNQWSRRARSELSTHDFMRFGACPEDGEATAWAQFGRSRPGALERAESRLLETVRSRGRWAFDNFVKGFGADEETAADHLIKLWPKLKQRYPDLAPELLENLVTYLVATNSPVIDEFRESLGACAEHPERVRDRRAYFGTLDMWNYDWSMNRQLYPLALEIVQARRRAAVKCPDISFDECDKVRLVFVYWNLQRWREALGVCEELGENPIKMDFEGPWGGNVLPFLPAAAAAEFRRKLGLPPVKTAGRFDFGSPCLCLHAPSAIAAAEGGLWVATGGQLLGLDFNLITNVCIVLPLEGGFHVSALCVGPRQVWIGTEGAGLIEYDKATRKCHLMTEADGLLRNDIKCLYQDRNALWIGCGNVAGGLARLDLNTGRLSALTRALPAYPLNLAPWTGSPTSDSPNGPPTHSITDLGGGLDGDLWMLVSQVGPRRYLPASEEWSPAQGLLEGKIVTIATDHDRLVAGLGFDQVIATIETKGKRSDGTVTVVRTNLVMTSAELRRFEAAQTKLGPRVVSTTIGALKDAGAIGIYDLRESRWQTVLDRGRLPAVPTKVLMEGGDIWVGGWGYVAVVDLAQKAIRSMCRIPSATVEHLQVAGGYLWAQFDRHLYRVPVQNTQSRVGSGQ